MNSPRLGHAHADALVERLLQKDTAEKEKGNILNDLLECFYDGYPVSNLSRLASSEDQETVRDAAWLTSELGSRACELYDELKILVGHEDSKVRFCMADCVLLCSGRDDGETIAKLVRWVEDQDAGLRWKAMDTLVRLGDEQFEAAREWLESADAEDAYQKGLKLILSDAVLRNSFEAIRRAVISGSDVLKRLAFVAAIRNHLGPHKLQELVSLSHDNDILEFHDDYVP